jgi:hypothetical protein
MSSRLGSPHGWDNVTMRILTTTLALALACLTPPPLHAAASLSAGDGYGYVHGAFEAALSEPVEATAQYYPSAQPSYQEKPRKRQEGGRVIPPSVALQVALSYSPGSQGLGVSLLRGPRLMYSVKLKTGNQIHRVLVDAQTAQVVGQ